MSIQMMRLVGCVAVVAMLLLPATAIAAPPVQGDTWHVVAPGETLSGIAARYGVSISELVLANGLRDANAIYSGQRLLIPMSGGPALAAR
jgi:LysM repeat protein